MLLSWGAAARAEVEIAFHSKDFASTFPHAFVRLTGTVDSTGETIDVNYGFTPQRLSLKILSGPVHGVIQTVTPAYVARSDRHFSLKLNEAQYRTVLGLVESWRNAPQPSYYLDGRNCVTFIQHVAMSLGLTAPDAPRLMKKPKSYLRLLTAQNAQAIRRWPQPASLAPGSTR